MHSAAVLQRLHQQAGHKTAPDQAAKNGTSPLATRGPSTQDILKLAPTGPGQTQAPRERSPLRRLAALRPRGRYQNPAAAAEDKVLGDSKRGDPVGRLADLLHIELNIDHPFSSAESDIDSGR